jgi:peroxisomal coenzyme A diphosphatase NUDT7
MAGYGRQPEFELTAPGAPTREQRIAWAMLSKPDFRKSCEKEGLRVDWALVRRMAGGEGDGREGKENGMRKGGIRWWRRGIRSKL